MEYSQTTTINVPSREVFDYLANVQNLPTYFPRVTSAQQTDHDKVQVTAQVPASDGAPEQQVEGEAWMKVEQDGKTLTWGAHGPNNYTGQLDVDSDGENRSTVTIRITSNNADTHRIQHGLHEALQGVKQSVESPHS